MQGFLIHAILKHPRKILFFSLTLALFSIIHAFFYLKLDTNQDSLISAHLEYQKKYQSFLKEFGDQENIIVLFKGEKNKVLPAMQRLNENLKHYPDYFIKTEYKLDIAELKKTGLFLISNNEFDESVKEIENHIQFLNYLSKNPNLESYLNWTLSNLKSSQHSFQNLDESIVLGNLRKLQISFQALNDPNLWNDFFSGTKKASLDFLDEEGFYRSGPYYLFQTLPKKDFSQSNIIDVPLLTLREAIKEIKILYPDLEIGITGRPVLQNDEMNSASHESMQFGILAFIFISVLFYFYFRNLKTTLLTVASLCFGLTWTLGFISIFIGHLNLLTLVFAIILMGLGIDFGIHFLIAFKNEFQKHNDFDLAIKDSLKTNGKAIFIGALSTSLAFLTALFSGFLGLQELALVAGIGVVLCLISQIVVLPALLSLYQTSLHKITVIQFKDHFQFEKKTALKLIVTLTLCIPCYFPLLKVSFDNNLLNLQDPNLESVHYEKELIAQNKLSTWVTAFLSPNINDIKIWSQQLSHASQVQNYFSILDFTPHLDSYRIEKISLLSKSFIREQKSATGNDPNQIMERLKEIQKEIEKLNELSFEAGKIQVFNELESISLNLQNLENQYLKNTSLTKDQLLKSQNVFLNHISSSREELSRHLEIPSNILIPDELKNKFHGKTHYALYVTPKFDLWIPENMKAFLMELQSISPEFTGTPVTVFESGELMKKGFFKVALLTFIVICFILLVDLKSLWDTLLALCPLGLGIFILLGIMGYFKIHINLGNFFALPILLGIGIDDGVHIIHHFRREQSLALLIKEIFPAITLTSLSTCIGFGSLSFVSHQGLASFGKIMAFGSLTCLFASISIVPLLLALRKK